MRASFNSARFGLAVLALSGCGAEIEVPSLPIADAGFDSFVRAGQPVLLDGSRSSDPAAAPLSYMWTLASRPSASAAQLQVPTSDKPTLPTDVLGSYVVSLVVSNGRRESVPDAVVITAANEAPVASAVCVVADCTVLHDRQARLRGDGSFDPEIDPLVYSWRQIQDAGECQSTCPQLNCTPSALPAILATPSEANTDFVAPDAKDQQLVFALTVSDGQSDTTACVAYTTFNRAPINSTPSANPAAVDEGATLTLSAVASDQDSAPGGPNCPAAPASCSDVARLTFLWEQVAGTPAATLTTPTSVSTQVTTPPVTVNTTLQFRLTVSDGVDQTVGTPVTVTVRNL